MGGPSLPGEWKLLVRQSTAAKGGKLFPRGRADGYVLADAKVTDPCFADLRDLEQYRNGAGEFEFCLRWPRKEGVWDAAYGNVKGDSVGPAQDYNHWKQTSNPAKDSIVVGYKALDVPYTGNQWCGLLTGRSQALLTGCNNDWWWYAVGSHEWFGEGKIPGPNITEKDGAGLCPDVVELWVRVDNVKFSPPSLPGEWKLLVRQSTAAKGGKLFPRGRADGYVLADAKVTDPCYADLRDLEQYRNGAGEFEFCLRWPRKEGVWDAAYGNVKGDSVGPAQDYNHWKQTSNPAKDSIVVGYKALDVPYTGNQWCGLLTGRSQALLTGCNNDWWWYAVGSHEWYGEGKIPGPNISEKDGAGLCPDVVELWVRVDNVEKVSSPSLPGEWKLLVRQSTAAKGGKLFPRGRPNGYVLADAKVTDPCYADLRDLEQYRNGAGEFEFCLRWPRKEGVWDAAYGNVKGDSVGPAQDYNHWKQTSNPAKDSIVVGYKALDVPYTGNQWCGLLTGRSQALLTGCNNDWWWYAVGSHEWYGEGKIPGPNITEKDGAGLCPDVVELWVRVDNVEKVSSPSLPGEWKLLVRQSTAAKGGKLFPRGRPNGYVLADAKVTDPCYADLRDLEQYRNGAGEFEFCLRWPRKEGVWDAAYGNVKGDSVGPAQDYNHWKQTSNPAKDSIVVGYKALDVPYTGNQWCGLLTGRSQALLTGCNNDWWWYAVGSHEWYGEGKIPGPNITEKDGAGLCPDVVELWVRVDNVKKVSSPSLPGEWKLLVRQSTAAKGGKLFPRGRPNGYVLADAKVTDPCYADLRDLEQYRNGAGEFEFCLRWPRKEGVWDAAYGNVKGDSVGPAQDYNHWKQTSNPTKEIFVDGYKALDAPYTGNQWCGLLTGRSQALLTGCNNDWWWYAVGSHEWYGEGKIPGPNITEKDGAGGLCPDVVELWVRVDNAVKGSATATAPPAAKVYSDEFKYFAFLSHTQRDPNAKLIASEIYAGFKEQGLPVWLDVKMTERDVAAMRAGVVESACFIPIITDNGQKDCSYFSREMCRQELMWAEEHKKIILPIVDRDDKGRIGAFISSGRDHGVDLANINFCTYDRTSMTASLASLQEVVNCFKTATFKSALLEGASINSVVRGTGAAGEGRHGGSDSPDKVKAQKLAVWLMEKCKFDASDAHPYAEAIVGVGVDKFEDLPQLEEADWPADKIKKLHLRKIQDAVKRGI
eukprot:g5510.t1